MSLEHRGPHDEGLFIDNNLALGHRALYTDSFPVPHQPLANEDGVVWITFDGEIYNKGKIVEQLRKNHVFCTDSSAETLVHAYEEYGFECLSKLNGMFSFCLWDSKNRWIFSARDRFGMKPIYYYSCEGRFIVASEIKGILADPSIPRRPNPDFVYEYLVTGYPTKNGETLFQGITELKPAHYMVMSESGTEIRKYWQPKLQPNPRTRDDNWCASEYRRLLHDSIRIRLPENPPVGTFLSGGLDSTSIVFIVDEIIKSQRAPNPVGTKCQEIFSAIYETPTEQGDERSSIGTVERALGTEVNYVFPHVLGQWENIRQFVSSIEEPVAVFNYYVFWCLFQTARKKAKVVLSGQGNDAILAGQTDHVLTYFRELWERKKIARLLNELFKSLDWILPYLVYSALFKMNAETRAKTLLDQGFVGAHSQDVARKKDDSLEDALLRDVTEHAVEYLRVDDRASSAFSMECRHPFLDHRIVQFAFSLSAAQKIRNGWTKFVLRNAMKGIIPEPIRMNRKKLGTPIPQQRWMKELDRNIAELFQSPKFRKRGYFNQAAVLTVFHRYIEGRLSRLERQYYADVLWRILNLELWLQTFFDPEDETRLPQ